MSIIFQLFSAEDLKKLDKTELCGLHKEIATTLKDARLSENGKLHLNLPPKTGLDNESSKPLTLLDDKWVGSLDDKWKKLFEEWKQFAHKSLLKRFHEVSHQLKTPSHDPPQQEFKFGDLIQERKSQETLAKEELILKWAISCELNHLEFYFALLVAKQAANEFFEKPENVETKKKLLPEDQRKDVTKAKIRFKDPDSVYSPFNPRHPGNKEYFDLSKSVSEVTGQTASSGT